MAWRLELYFSDGTTELVDEEFETEEDARDDLQAWSDGWAAGAETLELAGEDYNDADIVGFDIYEE